MSRYTLSKYISRLMAILLAAIFLLGSAPAVSAAEASGSCGDNLEWSLTDGILTITGSGAMEDYNETDMAPWHDHRGSITKVVFPEGMTSVGNLAFYDCTRLTSVDLPDCVRSIGAYAFAGCEKLEILDLGTGLESIGKGSFYSCWSLTTVKLPQSLVSIGSEAFYDCIAITSIVIPANVSNLGSATFAYCTDLIRAEIQTRLTKLPDWTFFGCSQLTTVILPDTLSGLGNSTFRDCTQLSEINYSGNGLTKDEIKENVVKDVPGFSSTGSVSEEYPGNYSVSGGAYENQDGSVTEQTNYVVPGENSMVSSKTEYTTGSQNEVGYQTDITITVENNDGWEEAKTALEDILNKLHEIVQYGDGTQDTDLTVYIKDNESLSPEFVDSIAGRDIKLTVVTQSGSTWKIDCGTLYTHKLTGVYDLQYTVSEATEEKKAMVGVKTVYALHFSNEASVEAEVIIQLPDSAARQRATLFEVSGKNELIQHQTTVVDGNSQAHLFLGHVDEITDYYIAINVPGSESDARIPDELSAEYPKIDYKETIRYEITGRKSSWGMTFNQVTWIMAGVLGGCVVLVGIVMYILNKRKLRMGYVPEWDDEGYE